MLSSDVHSDPSDENSSLHLTLSSHPMPYFVSRFTESGQLGKGDKRHIRRELEPGRYKVTVKNVITSKVTGNVRTFDIEMVFGDPSSSSNSNSNTVTTEKFKELTAQHSMERIFEAKEPETPLEIILTSNLNLVTLPKVRYEVEIAQEYEGCLVYEGSLRKDQCQVIKIDMKIGKYIIMLSNTKGAGPSPASSGSASNLCGFDVQLLFDNMSWETRNLMATRFETEVFSCYQKTKSKTVKIMLTNDNNSVTPYRLEVIRIKNSEIATIVEEEEQDLRMLLSEAIDKRDDCVLEATIALFDQSQYLKEYWNVKGVYGRHASPTTPLHPLRQRAGAMLEDLKKVRAVQEQLQQAIEAQSISDIQAALKAASDILVLLQNNTTLVSKETPPELAAKIDEATLTLQQIQVRELAEKKRRQEIRDKLQELMSRTVGSGTANAPGKTISSAEFSKWLKENRQDIDDADHEKAARFLEDLIKHEEKIAERRAAAVRKAQELERQKLQQQQLEQQQQQILLLVQQQQQQQQQQRNNVVAAEVAAAPDDDDDDAASGRKKSRSRKKSNAHQQQQQQHVVGLYSGSSSSSSSSSESQPSQEQQQQKKQQQQQQEEEEEAEHKEGQEDATTSAQNGNGHAAVVEEPALVLDFSAVQQQRQRQQQATESPPIVIPLSTIVNSINSNNNNNNQDDSVPSSLALPTPARSRSISNGQQPSSSVRTKPAPSPRHYNLMQKPPAPPKQTLLNAEAGVLLSQLKTSVLDVVHHFASNSRKADLATIGTEDYYPQIGPLVRQGFCVALYAILNHGFRENTRWFGTAHIWDVFKAVVERNKNSREIKDMHLRNGVTSAELITDKWIQTSKEKRTNYDLCTAKYACFVCRALNEKSLTPAMEAVLRDKITINKHYNATTAAIAEEICVKKILKYIDILNKLPFQLTFVQPLLPHHHQQQQQQQHQQAAAVVAKKANNNSNK